MMSSSARYIHAEQAKELITYMSYEHLPEHLQEVSRPFCDLARQLYESATQSGDVSTQTVRALEYLLAAKDCAVRDAVNRKMSQEVER